MKLEVPVRSVVLNWMDHQFELTDKTTNKKYILPLDTPIHVVMIGYPDREEKDLLARELDPYISRGYIFERIDFEEKKG